MNAFASYSRKDAAVVGSIVAGLEGIGHTVWFDTDDIRGGDQWRQAIIDGIASSEKLLLFLSPNSVVSANVQREVTVADEQGLRIIPVLLAPCDVPGALQYSLAGVHWIDASSQPTADTVREIDGILSAADSPAVASLPADPRPNSASPRADPPPPAASGTVGVARRGDKGRSKRLVAAGAGAVGLLVVVIGVTRCGSDNDPPTEAAATEVSVSATADVSSTPAETLSAPLPTAESATTSTTSVAAAPQDIPAIVSVTTADGRSTLFGGMSYEIESVRISNGLDASFQPTFEGTPTEIGDRAVVRVDAILQNTTDGVLFYVNEPRLRLADDPIVTEGTLSEYDAVSFGAGAGGRVSYDFVLPRGAAVDPATLQGATLLLADGSALSDGIPLDGAPHEPLLATPVPVGAAAFFDGDAGGTITVDSVEPALEARGWLGSGSDGPADYRMSDGEIWLVMDLTFECVGRLSGRASCYFGLEQDGFRVDVDGVVEGFSVVQDFTITDAAPELQQGTSARGTVMMRVPVGDTYTLLLGDPADPAAVTRTPMDIKAAVAALYESVALFQQ